MRPRSAPEVLWNALTWAGVHVGIGASRKMGKGRFTLTPPVTTPASGAFAFADAGAFANSNVTHTARQPRTHTANPAPASTATPSPSPPPPPTPTPSCVQLRAPDGPWRTLQPYPSGSHAHAGNQPEGSIIHDDQPHTATKAPAATGGRATARR
jgi:hypothetical protein